MTYRKNIFAIKTDLINFGFHYVLWSEGLSIRTLYEIWIANGMIKHERNALKVNYI